MPGENDRGRILGSLIAVAFGLVYVAVNSWPLPSAASWFVRAVAIAMAAATAALIAIGAARGRPGDDDTDARGGGVDTDAPDDGGRGGGDAEVPGVSRGYWMIVAAEAAALFGGLAVVNGVFHAPHAGVAWVSVVVGAHFFPMAHVFRLAFFHLLGGIIASCGLIGLVLAGLDPTGGAAAVVAGVIPGFVLLGFGMWGVRPRPPVDTGTWRP